MCIFVTLYPAGRVVIQAVFGDERSVYAYKRPVKALAIGPEFHKSRQYCVGGMSGQLILHEKGTHDVDYSAYY